MKRISCKQAKLQGLARYFTGKPCPHGHITERRVINRSCCGCNKDWEKTYQRIEYRKKQFPKWYRELGGKKIRKIYYTTYSATDEGRAKLNAQSGLRRARKIKATPDWITKEQKKEIGKIYMSCPKGFHVDHIIPLKGKNVCGLHISNNLRVVPASINLHKANRFN